MEMTPQHFHTIPDVPVKIERPQAVVMGEKIYMGGGDSENHEENHRVFQYDPSRDEWRHLPLHHVRFFAMAQFMGHLITVGGVMQAGDYATGKVHRFIEQFQNWEEFLKPMPTARVWPSVATTQSAIVASGGATVL